MTVEVTPETGELIRQEISLGHVHSVDELVEHGVRAVRERHAAAVPPRAPRQNLADFLMNSPFAGANLDLDRQKDFDRPVDL